MQKRIPSLILWGLSTMLVTNLGSTMITVGKKAPEFTAQAVIDGQIKDISLSEYSEYYKLLIFYPLDFTFVCPTELHALQEKLSEFANRKILVMAISVDSVYSHLAWLGQPKEKGGIAGVQYPLVSDINKTIAADYGVLDESGVALRGAFILDRDNIVQAAMVNNLPIGRNIDEMLRLFDAVQHVEKVGEVCPVNWQEGQEAMEATNESVVAFFQNGSEVKSQQSL